MKITLHNVMPTPLASIQHGEKSIWGKKVELSEGERILLNASSGKGKSTFLNSVSNSGAKTASYPFTTLNPIVGTIDFDDFTIASDRFFPVRLAFITTGNVQKIFNRILAVEFYELPINCDSASNFFLLK